MKVFKFRNDEERNQCNKYLDLKGVAYHVLLINKIGLDNKGKISYKLVSDVYKYDKRLRNRLYKFLSAFEEQIRAFIANSYNHGLESLQLGELILTNLKSGSNIAYELEDLTFNQLLQIVENLNSKDLKRIFPNSDKYLLDNLKAIKELRNAISHHRILFLYDEYETCYINGKPYNDLSNNIINLKNLINEYYKQFLVDSINDSVNDKRDNNYYIPQELIIKIN
ncbi:MAG TPA: Abi family protein [Gallicola sp.]|nr:Abi family protein [Gallicola sp.]